MCVYVLGTRIRCAKTVEPIAIEMPFGAELSEPCIRRAWGVHIGSTWRVRWIDLCGDRGAASDYRYCSNLLVFVAFIFPRFRAYLLTIIIIIVIIIIILFNRTQSTVKIKASVNYN